MQREHTPRKWICFLLPGLVLAGWVAGVRGDAPTPVGPPAPLPTVLENADPLTLKALREQQNHWEKLANKLRPCVVGIRIGPSQGSGVIINKEGHVLTAGHVSGPAGREALILFADGRKAKGKTLGANRSIIDSGLVQITDKGDWPHVEMGNAADLKKGTWCLGIGHPGGFQNGRTPVVRMGRVLEVHKTFLRTDSALVGGDSGGALFDMNGKVIGIHSRIGWPMTYNFHVPVDTFKETWARLAKGEVWGLPNVSKTTDAYLGVDLFPEQKPCKVRQVTPDSPAAKAGLQTNDIVTMFGDKKIGGIEDLFSLLAAQKPGNEVTLQVKRGQELLTVRVILGKKPA